MRLTGADIVGVLLLLVGTLSPGPAKPVAGQGITVEEYEPRNTLVTSEHVVTRARFPFVDIHGHQGGARMSSGPSIVWSGRWTSSTWRSW